MKTEHPVFSNANWFLENSSEAGIGTCVDRVLKLLGPRPAKERRSDRRSAFPHLITLTPFHDDECRSFGDPVTVVGRELSAQGLDFYHTEVLPCKRAIITFDSSVDFHTHLVIDISWCRFLRPGWYDSGGKFTHLLRSSEDSIEFEKIDSGNSYQKGIA